MPGDPVVLDNHGGIVAIGRPEDLPEGASPRNNDVDFLVGRFIQRPGTQNVYTNVLTSFGPITGGSAVDVDTESMPWVNPANILLDDGSFTTNSLLGESGIGSVLMDAGGYYGVFDTITVTFSGPGPGGGTGVASTVSHPGSGIVPPYKTVSGVVITNPGVYTGAVTVAFTGASDPSNNATGTVVLAPANQTSDNIRVTDFGFSVPQNYVINGIGVSIKGFAPNATVYAQLVKGGTNVGFVESVALPTSNGFVQLGGESDLWGSTWNYSDIDSPNFGLEIWANSPDAETVSLDFVEITVYGIPDAADFKGIVAAKLNQTDQVTLALDASGLTWQEDVTNNPGQLVLDAIIPDATPGSYLKGLDADGVAFMAYSDLTQGVSQPVQYNGRWADRITQVGPGKAPVFTPQQASGTTFPITSITQPAAMSDYNNPGTLNDILQSEGPSSTSPGNVITVFYSLSYDPGVGPQPAAEDTLLDNTFNSGVPVYVYISGTAFADGTYLVTGIGNALPPGAGYYRYYFTVQASSSSYQKSSGHAGTYQMTLATLTAANPVPGLVVGNNITVSGASVPAWDATWPIIQSLNSAEMVITQTSVTASVATYNYSVVTGTAPAAGELVTITNTNNADGLLNLTNATIATASGGASGTFTVSVSVISAPSVPEAGQATTAGTQFTIDPGPADAGTASNPILGNSTGGSLTFSGATAQFITPGIKQGSVFFITRNGAVTRPAPPVTFEVPANCGSITASQVPVGPEDVIARGITFTESGQNGVKGASFYYYDSPVSYTVNGVAYTSDALIIPNNLATSATFSFSDSVLLASDEIDIPGNNYFNLIELGNPAWIFQYAERMLYGLCQTKIQNFLNLSFDGGYLPTQATTLPLPMGWSVNNNATPGNYTCTAFSITSDVVTFACVNSLQPGYTVLVTGLGTGTYLNGIPLIVDTASGTEFTASFSHADVTLTSDTGTVTVTNSSVGLVTSLDFGNAIRIINYGDANWTNAEVLFQPAYQDYLGVNIIQPNTPYSVRVKARAITNPSIVTIQLPTYASGVFGTSSGSASFTFPTGGYSIQTAELITGNGLSTVPATMQLALGISALAPGNGIEVDRVEIFPTNRPVDTTTVWTSYVGKYESIDGVSGQLGVGTENPQPATGAFEILEQLYITKTRSLQVTQDSPNYEPNNWQVRQASDRAGAVGPNAYDEGEEFAVIASRNGIYFFDGGKPMPIAQELQSDGYQLNLWNMIEWTAGTTIWVRNDLDQRRLLIGLPMTTPNFFLPNAPAATPSSPNVILICNYTGCPTGEQLAMSDQVHVTMFGDLKSLDMRRKWSLWQIPCPAAEFVPRQDSFTAPLFLCNGIGSSKIYQLVAGAPSGGQNTDDGAAINWNYTTYGFTKAKQGQQNPMLGALRKVWYYLTATMEGVGQISAKLLSNSLGALPRNTFTIPKKFTLSYPQQNDQERVLEIGGQRVFIEFSSVGTGGYAEVGTVMLDGEMDKNSPHRGVAS